MMIVLGAQRIGMTRRRQQAILPVIRREQETLIHRPVRPGINDIRLDDADLSHGTLIGRLKPVFPEK